MQDYKLDYCQTHNTYGFNKDGVWYLGGVANQSCQGPDESGSYKYTIRKMTGSTMQMSMDADGKKALTTFKKQS
jgi:hypothetical protein